MKDIYKLSLLFCLLFTLNSAFATVKYEVKITEVSVPNSYDCDDCNSFCFALNTGESEFRIGWEFASGGSGEYQWGSANAPAAVANPSGGTISPNQDCFYSSTMPLRVRGFEQGDETSADAETGWQTINITVSTAGVPNSVDGAWSSVITFDMTAPSDNNCNGDKTVEYRVKYQWRWYTVYPEYDAICSAENRGTIALNNNTTSPSADNTCAGVSGNDPDIAADNESNTTWHYFETPTAASNTVPTRIDVSIKNDEVSPVVRVFKAPSKACPATPNTMPAVTGGEDPFSGDANVGFDCPEANTRYYIMVDGDNDNDRTGDYRVQITSNGSVYQANDMVANAITITPSGSAGSIVSAANSNNFCCGVEASEPGSSCGDLNSVHRSVWYKFTALNFPLNKLEITTDNGVRNFDTGLSLFLSPDGSANFSQFYEVGCDEDISITNYGSKIATECLSPGSVYYVRVDGENSGDVGNFRLDIKTINNTFQPSNDNICNATNIGGADQTLNANVSETKLTGENNKCATTEPGEGAKGGAADGSKTIWYKFKTDNNPPAYVEVDADGGLFNGNCCFLGICGAFYPRVKVFKSHSTAAACAGISQITLLNDEDNLDQTYFKYTCLEPNTWYYVQVETGFGSICPDGSLDIQLKGGPARDDNDFICEAKSVTVQTKYTYNHYDLLSESNINATNCFEPNPDWTFETGQDNDHGVWYYIGQVPGRTVVIDANSTSNDIDLQMALYSTTSAKVSCTTPATSPTFSPALPVELAYGGAGVVYDEDAYFNCLDPNKYYWLMIDGSAGPTSLLSYLEEGNFSLKFWFPEEGETTLCAAEDLGAIGVNQIKTFPNLSNKCGINATTTKFGTSGTVAFSGFSFDNAVIYKFTAPASGSVKIEAKNNPYYDNATYYGGGAGADMGTVPLVPDAGDEIDLQLGLMQLTGSCTTGNLSMLASSYNADDLFNEDLIYNCLIPGGTYYIVVDGSGLNSSGYFDLIISDYGKTTPNELICNATPIPGTFDPAWMACNYTTPTSLTNQNNYCGSSNAPAIPGVTNNAGVWYMFKAPSSGKVLIEAKNTISDLLPPYQEPEMNINLAVFRSPTNTTATTSPLATCPTGNSTISGALELITYDYDGVLHDEDLTVECLNPGETYFLYVDGQNTGAVNALCTDCNTGEFYITITPDGRDRPSTNDQICDAIPLGTPVYNTTVVGTKIGAGFSAPYVNSIPTTGYGPLHNLPRSNAAVCMRAENNFCKGTAGEPAVSGGTFLTDFTPEQTVWYEFTAPATGEVVIDAVNNATPSDNIELQLALYESSDNTCSGTMQAIKAEYNVGGGGESMTVKCLNPGQKYWLMVDGYKEPVTGYLVEGYFEVSVKAVPATQSAPVNDDICALGVPTIAYPASVGSTTTLTGQTNRCATAQVSTYPSPTTFTTDADVWYKFTTPNTAGPHAVEITVTSGLPWPFGDAMDPQIALYQSNGACGTNFTLIEDDYSALGTPFVESFEFHCLDPNTTYYLMVDGSGLNEQGNFKIDIKRINPHPLPTNDDICQVAAMASGSGANLGVLGTSVGNSLGSHAANSEWHNFCSDVETGESNLMTDGNYTLDQTVWFKFRTPGTAGSSPNVNVDIEVKSDPNNKGDAIDLQMLLTQGNPTGCPSAASATTFASLSPIESVDPALTFDATMSVCLPAGTDFYINADGSGLNTQGYFTLKITNTGTTTVPENDNICGAKPLSIGANTYTGSGYSNENNNCFTKESSEVEHSTGAIQRSAWYKFVAPASTDVSIEVAGLSLNPFSSGFFLPEVTVWEVIDGTANSPCVAGATYTTKLAEIDYQVIPNTSIAPTVTLTPLCLRPGYTYYVQVDGVNGIGIDGAFDIRIKNNQPSYVAPANDEKCGATGIYELSVNSKSCQFGSGAWSNQNYGNSINRYTRSTQNSTGTCGINNCRDQWFSFIMPASGFAKIEGNDEMGVAGINNSDLSIVAYSSSDNTCNGTFTQIACGTGGVGQDPDFSIKATPASRVWLQVFDENGNDFGDNFQICVSAQCSPDNCLDASNMTLDSTYCWSVEAYIGESPSAAGSGLKTCNNHSSGNTLHSTYFKFTTDAANTSCDDYYIYVNTSALAKQFTSSSTSGCNVAGPTPSTFFTMTVYELKPGGSPCTPGLANVTQRDCVTWDDCAKSSFNAGIPPNVSPFGGIHGAEGIVSDTMWYNYGSEYQLSPATTYYIVMEYYNNTLNPGSDREILDGTITVGRRCKGRTWEYTNTSGAVSTNKYCTTQDGWRHYYDDKGTVATADDKYIFSLYPNGNNIEGTATVTLNPTRYNYEDIPRVYAEYVMKRRWDFTLSSGSIDPAKPVKIRFYYQTTEKQDIIDAANTFKNAYGGFYEDFEWFKSENGHVFDVVNDVNPKVISVGTNGFSETGCLSYWNDLGVFVGSPGISRCQSLSASDWEDDNLNQWCNGVHYVQYNGLTGFSGGTGGTGVSPWDVSPLPVELTSFTGYNSGDKNVLDWTTSSERNTLKFEVERSPQSIGGVFTYIGELPAAGSSNVPLSYHLNDNNPLTGDNYYRLKMIDIDGTFKYSQTIFIRNDKDVVYTNAINGIYPNPTSHLINIDYQSAAISKVEIKILNVVGQEMSVTEMNTLKGNQLLQMDVSSFADGVYIINIRDVTNGTVQQSKFIKD
jgi:hypothetical protein